LVRDLAQVSEYARVVIGADGVHSRVAGQVNAQRYREGPVLASAYYAYWSGVCMPRERSGFCGPAAATA
jgi:flavin-dependent dehydrogenase